MLFSGIPELTEEQVQRLLQAASMISDGDKEIEETILEGSAKNVQQFISESDGTEESIEDAVSKAEGLMPDLAFGDTDDAIDDAIDILLQEEEDDTSDEFMGGGSFESLDELEEQEMSQDKLSYEEFQEEWN